MAEPLEEGVLTGQLSELRAEIRQASLELVRLRQAAATLDALIREPTVGSALTPTGFQLKSTGSATADPGAATSGAAYGANEQTMLQAAYDFIREHRSALLAAHLQV